MFKLSFNFIPHKLKIQMKDIPRFFEEYDHFINVSNI